MFRSMLFTALVGIAIVTVGAQASQAGPDGNYRLRPPRHGHYWRQYGLQVTGVVPGSPAWRQGLQPGDVIASVNGNPVPTLQDLHYWIGTAGGAAQMQVIDRSTGRWVWVTVYPVNGLIGAYVQSTLLPGYGPYYPPIGRPVPEQRTLDSAMPTMPQMPAMPSLPTIQGSAR